MKKTRKAIALLLSVLMTLSLFSIVGYAEEGTENPGPFTVHFYSCSQNNEGQTVRLIDTQTVQKGANAKDISKDEDDPEKELTEAELKVLLDYPKKKTQPFHKWSFNGWKTDITNVQSDLEVYPDFQEAPKQYKINYFNYDGTAAQGLNSEYCLYGGMPKESSLPSRDGGLSYNYLFKCWSLKPNVDPTVNEEDEKYLLDWHLGVNLPGDGKLGRTPGQAGYINLDGDTEPIELNVYAYYTRHNKEYPLSLTVVDQYGQRLAGADVQVLGTNGLLLDQTFEQTGADGKPTGRLQPAAGKTKADGTLFMRLPYQTEYTIQVSYGDYEGAKIKKTSIEENAQGVTIQLETAAQYNEQNKARCTCACHSFIGGIWVTCLNLMYTLFKVKYVCCYDMYATHGDKLAYGG